MRAVTNLTENTDLTTSVMGMAFHWTITTIFNICQSPTLLSFPFSAKRVFAVPWVLSPFVWVAMSWVVCEAVAFSQLYPHLKGWSIQYRSKVSWHSILDPCMNRESRIESRIETRFAMTTSRFSMRASRFSYSISARLTKPQREFWAIIDSRHSNSGTASLKVWTLYTSFIAARIALCKGLSYRLIGIIIASDEQL